LATDPRTEIHRLPPRGQNAVHFAAVDDEVGALRVLVEEYGLDPDKESSSALTPLLLAVINGCCNAVRYLIFCPRVDPNHISQNGDSALLVAIRQGSDAVVDVLLDCPRVERGAGRSLSLAVQFGRFTAFKRLFCGIDLAVAAKQSLLHEAVLHDQAEIAGELLKCADIDVNAGGDGETPFHVACERGTVGMLKLFMGDPRVDINRRTPAGSDALAFAMKYGHLEVARLLISVPAVDVNDARGVFAPALFLAVSFELADAVEWLCARSDGQVNKISNWSVSRTPLMEAARLGNVGITEILLRHPDIDARVRTLKWGPALKIAKEQNCVEVAAMIEAHLQKGGGLVKRLGWFFS
jgi:ankyrin repeat protein